MKYTLHILLTVCAFSVIMPPSHGEGEPAKNPQVAVPQEGTTEEDKKKEIDEGSHGGEKEKDKKSLVAQQQPTEIKEENNTKDNDKGSHGEEEEDTMIETKFTSLNKLLNEIVEKNNMAIHECSHGKEETADNPQVAVPQEGTTEEYKKKKIDEGSHGGEEEKDKNSLAAKQQTTEIKDKGSHDGEEYKKLLLLDEQLQKFKKDINKIERYKRKKTILENFLNNDISYKLSLELGLKDRLEMQHLIEEIQRETENNINNEGENKETKSKYTKRQNGLKKVKQLIVENIEELEKEINDKEKYQREIMNVIEKFHEYQKTLYQYIIKTEDALKYFDNNKGLPLNFQFISEDIKQEIYLQSIEDIYDQYKYLQTINF